MQTMLQVKRYFLRRKGKCKQHLVQVCHLTADTVQSCSQYRPAVSNQQCTRSSSVALYNQSRTILYNTSFFKKHDKRNFNITKHSFQTLLGNKGNQPHTSKCKVTNCPEWSSRYCLQVVRSMSDRWQ
jgi:hypothetical protein